MEPVTKITWANLTMLIPTDIPSTIISPMKLLTMLMLQPTTLLNHPLFQGNWLKDIDFLKCKIDKDTNKELDTITHKESSLLLIDINIILLKTKTEIPPVEEPHKTLVLRPSFLWIQ